MNCDGVCGLLSAYVDGELSAGELLRVEQHLRRCHWCADEVDALRQTIALVASLEEVEVPATFHVQLHNRLVALGPPAKAVRIAPAYRAMRQDFRRWAVPAAAVAALVIGVAGLNRFDPPVPRSPVAVREWTPGNSIGSDPQPLAGQTVSNNHNPGTGTNEPKSDNFLQGVSGQGTNSDQAPSSTANPKDPFGTTDSNATDTTTRPPLGKTDSNSGAHTASFLDNISDPGSYVTVMQPRALVEAPVVEPATLYEEIKAHFASATVREKKDPASGIIELQIILPSSQFKAGQEFVESRIGQQAVDQSLPLDLAQMDALYERLTNLESEREILEARRSTEPQAQKDLAKLQEEATQAREAYQKLVAMSESGTLSVTLKPMKAR